MNADAAYVIVGASLAGAKAAQTLREQGFAGPVVLIGEETERPYERRETVRRGPAGVGRLDQRAVPLMVLPAGRAAVWTCCADWAKMTVPAHRGGRHGR